MKQEDFLNIVKKVKAKFSEKENVFKVFDIEIKPPIKETKLEKIESKIGKIFPYLMREIYTNSCSGVSFLWYMYKDKINELGYEPDSISVGGNINLIQAEDIIDQYIYIKEIYGDENIIPIFQDDLCGDFYCLDFGQGQEEYIPIIVVKHDEMPNKKIICANFEEFFLKWAKSGFIGWIDGIFYKGELDLNNSDIKPIVDYLSL